VGVNVWVETEAEWISRVVAQSTTDKRLTRVRLVGAAASLGTAHQQLSEAVGGDPDLAVYANEVTTAGRIELLPFLHEQSITITAHRFGNPDAWSESVI
jgi:RHH-type proline utilization regulon transcriptional repressor/proline dehydrogenase/delta 1-pyrroline-5-carboxylate dehydrogenase